MVRGIFLMLAVLLHIEAIRFFNPRYEETPGNVKAPLVVQLKPVQLKPAPLPASPLTPPPSGQAAEPRSSGRSLPTSPPSPAARLPDTVDAAAPSSSPAPFYHSPHALTRPPELVEDAPEEIELGELQEPGHLLLRLAIDRYGVVNGVFVLRSTLARELEGQVVLQFYRARYRPGEIDGVPVNSEMLLVVNLQ